MLISIAALGNAGVNLKVNVDSPCRLAQDIEILRTVPMWKLKILQYWFCAKKRKTENGLQIRKKEEKSAKT